MGSGLVGGGGERRPRSNRDEAGHQLWGQGQDEPGAQGLWEQQELRKGSEAKWAWSTGQGGGASSSPLFRPSCWALRKPPRRHTRAFSLVCRSAEGCLGK